MGVPGFLADTVEGDTVLVAVSRATCARLLGCSARLDLYDREKDIADSKSGVGGSDAAGRMGEGEYAVRAIRS